MACCGDPTPAPVGPDNEPQPGDVLAQALWGGNRKEVGRVTRRIYPATSFPKTLYANADDVAAVPHLFRRVETPVPAPSGVVLQPQYQPTSDWQDVAGALFGGGEAQPTSQPIEYRPNTASRKKADTVKAAQARTGAEGKSD